MYRYATTRHSVAAHFRRPRQRRTASVALYVCVGVVVAAVGTADELPAAPAPQTGSDERVQVDAFTPARAVRIVTPDCSGTASGDTRSAPPEACRELLSGTEGWVQLSFMVDPSGKPHEIAVICSTGDRVFENAAREAIERSTFLPAQLNGKPIESARRMKVSFFNKGVLNEGAGSTFVHAYKTLMAAIGAGDRPGADAAFKALKITNLYEDAYFGLASYQYAMKWGDEHQQLQGLYRAIAAELNARYLPADTFRSALLESLKLQLKARQYAEALATWQYLEKAGIDDRTAAQIRSIVEQLEKIRTDSTAYAVSGLLPDGPWYLRLFKRNFQVVVKEGSISEVKLRCDKGYVTFPLDPAMQYHVANKYADCEMELDGAPGTRFDVVQS